MFAQQPGPERAARRSARSARSLTIGLILAVMLFPGLSSRLADASESGYRLLELDGHIVKWGDPRLGVGASISYAFTHEPMRFDGALNCSEMAPVDQLYGKNLSIEKLRLEAASAFRAWEQAGDLRFHEVGDAAEADIVIGALGLPGGRAYANVAYAPEPHDGVRAIEQALVCLNPVHEWKVGFDGNQDIYDIRHTLIHEIGHAIGLDHPGPGGQVMGFRYTEAFDNLQPGDRRGAQRLYGPADGGVAVAQLKVPDAGLAQDDPSGALAVECLAGPDARGLGIGGRQSLRAGSDSRSVPCSGGASEQQ